MVTPCVVEVLADKAHADGIHFFSRGEVILTEEIPPQFVGPIEGLSGSAGGGGTKSSGETKSAGKETMTFGRKPRFVTR